MRAVKDSTIVSRAGGLDAARLSGRETVVLSADLDNYYGLNRVASRVWELAETPCTVASICDTLVAEFEVDAETCRSQVSALIEELVEEALFIVHPKAS